MLEQVTTPLYNLAGFHDVVPWVGATRLADGASKHY